MKTCDLIAVGTLLISTTLHAQFVQQRTVDYPLEGVVLGNGWSSLSAAKTPGGCIEFAEVQDLSEDRTLDLKRIVDKEQLNRELSVSVEFQAKSIGGVGASAKASYSKSLEVKNEALNLVITAKVLQGARFVAPKQGISAVQLTAAAAQLAKTSLPQFVALCGDSFVAAVHAGGEMNAFLSFDIASRDERENVSASMSAGGLSYSGSATVNQTMRQYRETQKLRILMHSAGGSGVPIPVNETELLERLKNLPTDAKSAPKPYRISVARYDQLPNWPTASSLTATKFAEMALLVGQFQRYSSLYYDTYSVLQRPEAYVLVGGIDLESVRQLQDTLRLVVLPALSSRIVTCLAGADCSVPTDGAPLDYDSRMRMPVLKGSFTEDVKLRQLLLDRDATAASFAAMPDNVFLDLPKPFGGKIALPNVEKGKVKQKLEGLEVALQKAQAGYLAAVASAVQAQWIDTPSFHRCLEKPVWDYCLSNATLASYGDKIRALLASK